MRNLFSCYCIFMLSLFSSAQVGIGNTNPQAQLDVSATNLSTPTNTDGILIPRVSNLTATSSMTANQDGMLVFYKGTGFSGKGFYYWDHPTSWVPVTSNGDSDWLNILGHSSPTSINDYIYTFGQVNIGSIGLSNSSLYIQAHDTSLLNGLNISRFVNGTDNQTRSGFRSFNHVRGTSQYDGISSTIYGDGTGIKTSFRALNYSSNTTGNSHQSLFEGSFQENAGSYDLYGSNIFFSTATPITNTGSKYGYFADIDSSIPGTHYGIFTDVQKTDGYAGYFIGRASFGNSTANRYILPAVDGTSGQVMTTDGSGNLSWSSPSAPSSAMSSFKYPDGFSNIAPVFITDLQTNTYTVPTGKNLYLTNITSSGSGNLLFVNGVSVFRGVENFSNNQSVTNPIIVGSGEIISATVVSPTFRLNGFLIDANVLPVTFNSTYNVPANKILVILNYSNTNSNGYLVLNGLNIYRGPGNIQSSGLNSFFNPFYADSGDTIETTNGTVNGYLIDK